MGNVTLTLQEAAISVVMIVIIAIDLWFLVPITIKAGVTGERGYCFEGIMLALTVFMLACVFAYSLGALEKMLKVVLALLMYIYADKTEQLALKTAQEKKRISVAYLILSMLSILGMAGLLINVITG